MLDNDRIRKAMKLVEEDLFDAEHFLKQTKDRDCIQKLFQIYENCLNIIKDTKNGRPLSDHKAVTQQLHYYFELSILKKDYSSVHKRLDMLRKQASFGPYVKYKTKPATINEIKSILEEAKELVEETRKMV